LQLSFPRSAPLTLRAFPYLAALLATATLAGCGKKEVPPKPTPQVGYVVVQSSAVPNSTTLEGRTVAFETSEVRPQVNGVIKQRLFVEGSLVKKGQPLFVIDPSLYRAAVNQASANLESAQANAAAAIAKANRYKPLAAMEAVAKQDYSDAAAAAKVARATIDQNKAALDTARINLRYTTVPAPISGRIGRSLFTVGALTSASQTDPLALIQRIDPMYVDIQQSSSQLLALRRALSQNGIEPTRAQVQLTLEDGTQYNLPGTLEFTEVTVDQTTGTVTLRALFPNAQGVLLPGMFVRATFAQSIDTKALLVPQQAVTRDPKGNATVYVVGPNNKAVQRSITTTRTQGAYWVVTGGLQGGDKIITEGLQNVKPGVAIKPVAASTAIKIAPPEKGSDSGSGQGQSTAKSGG
jgi:membrane fusion protein (multidrug efflux system)